MSGVEALLTYLADGGNWQGAAGIPTRLLEHLVLAGLAVLTACLVALPGGLYIGHSGRFQVLGLNLANVGRALPSYAVMVMVFPVALAAAAPLGYDPRLGLTFLPIFVAMTLLAIPPILVSSFAGIAEVDRDVVGSSRGMGLSEPQVLRRVELPLALPVIIGGFRIATLQVIATATLGAVLSGGGLGRFIIDGLARRDEGMLYAGVVLVSGLAIGIDLLLAVLQRRLTPRGVRVASGEAVIETVGDLGSVAPPALPSRQAGRGR
jgi:osmoprotectant transport system permease protein